MTKPTRLRTALSATTILAAGLMLAAAPARAQSLPDTGNVTSVTSGLGGGAPGSTSPTFTNNGQTLQVNLRDNRTILNWRGAGFDIAANGTVDFKDARATSGVTGRTDNIAVLNRDLSNQMSLIYGKITSDPNVAVYLINRSGMIFFESSAVNTGSFIASTRNVTDADFFDGNGSMAFSGTGVAPIVVGDGARISTAATASSNGGRMGDTVLIASHIVLGTNSDASITATDGDVALIAAESVVVQNAAGSPLSIMLQTGSSTSWDLIAGRGNISGRNVMLAGALAGPSTSYGINYTGSIVATGATQTDRGVVLTVGSAASGVTLDSIPSNSPSAQIKSAGEISFTASSGNAITSTRDVVIGASAKAWVRGSVLAQGKVELTGGAAAVAQNATLSGAEIVLSGIHADLSGSLIATTGDVSFIGSLNLNSDGGIIKAERDIAGTSLSNLVLGNTEIRAGRDIVLAAGTIYLATPVTVAGRDISLSDNLPGASGTASLVFHTLNAGRDITIQSRNLIAGFDATSTGGKLSLTGQAIDMLAGRAETGAYFKSTAGDIKIQSLVAAGSSADLEIESAGYLTARMYDGTPAPVFKSGRDVKITTGGTASISSIQAGRNVIGRFGDIAQPASPYTNTITATSGYIDLIAGMDPLLSNNDVNRGYIGHFTLVAGTSIDVTSRGISLSDVTAQNGGVRLTATGGAVPSTDRLRAQTINATGDILLNATAGTVNVQSALTNGTINISGNDVHLASGAFRTPGAINLIARTGRILLLGGSIQSNSDGIGSEAILIESATSSSFNGTIQGGPARQSDVLVRFGSNATGFSASSITARDLLTARGSDPFSAGITDLNTIDIGTLTLTNSVLLHGNSVTSRNIRSVAGDVDIAIGGTGLALLNGSVSARDVRITTNGVLWFDSAGRIFGRQVVLSAADLVNFRGPDAISAQRWLVYLPQPGNAFNNLNSNNTAIWNATLATRDPSTITGNRYVFAQQPTLTFSTVDFSKIYGTDLTGSAAIPFAVSGYHPGVAGAFLADTAATAFSGNPLIQSAGFAERASVAGGPYTQTIAQGSLESASGYAFTFAPSTGLVTVTPKALTGGIAADNKVYDGNTAGTGSVSLDGVVAGDTVGTSGSVFTFADKNAGTGKTVNVAGTTLTGADSGNYMLTIPASALADILHKALNATITVNGKTYDGTTAATGSVALNGIVAGDDVGTAGTAFAFADKNAGTGKTVNVAGTTLTGADSGNYTLTIPATVLADILKKALSATIAVDGKTYDGTTAATGSVALNGVVSGDAVGTSGTSFAFADKNAGTGRTVNVAGTTLTGADSGNYTLTIPATALADILKKVLTASVAADGKTYDGTTVTTGSVSLAGVIDGDAVGTTGTAFTFADKNAGADKTVNVAGTTLNGADSGNYTLTVPATAIADILKKALTASVAADSKTYDGSTAATGTVALSGVVSGDAVSTGGITFTFADKNAGTGKTVAIGGSLSGADAGNYTVTLPATVLADILKKALTANVTVNGKTYDGTTAATGTVALDGVVGGDVLGTTGTTFSFTDKNAGTGRTVNVAGTTLTGADSGNYTLTIPASVLADITRRALSITADDKAKYTGDADPALTYLLTLGSLIAGDQLTGALARAPGETPGTYSIDQGALSAGSNYTITFTPGALTISVNPATNQQQTLRSIPLPAGIQAPPAANSGVQLGTEALCGEDRNCVVN